MRRRGSSGKFLIFERCSLEIELRDYERFIAFSF